MKKKKVFLIAEIGINHNGSLSLAKKLISQAKECGFDAVKFQKRDPDICTPIYKKKEIRNTPWGKISYLNYKKKIEFDRKSYDKIDKYCKLKKIIWLASPWDLNSLDFLKKYNPKYIKIASAMSMNLKLVEEVAKLKKIKSIVSTGICNVKDINNIVKIFKKYNNKNYALLHSVSLYPCPDEKLNLKCIINLKKKYNCEVGYSGHENGIFSSLSAVALGSTIIERHITLNKKMWGTDQSASLEKHEMKQLVKIIRNYENYFGDGNKKALKEELKKFKDQKYW